MVRLDSNGDEIQIRLAPFIGWLVGGLGGLSLIAICVIVLLQSTGVIPRPVNAPDPIGSASILVAFFVLFAGGFWFARNSPVHLILRREALEIPRQKLIIPWSSIAAIEATKVGVQGGQQGVLSPVILIQLTDKGKELIQNRKIGTSNLRDSPFGDVDICLSTLFLGIGHEGDPMSKEQFNKEVESRIAAATGRPQTIKKLWYELLVAPDPSMPLTLRTDLAESPDARVYIHDVCHQGTIISDSHFHWLCNPLRFVPGTRCMGCQGAAYPHEIRWEDTGERITDFRGRMWRHTPAWVKVTHWIILPVVLTGIGVLVMSLFVQPQAAKMSPLFSIALAIFTSACGAFMLTYYTPLAGIAPALGNLKYWKFK